MAKTQKRKVINQEKKYRAFAESYVKSSRYPKSSTEIKVSLFEAKPRYIL